MTTVSTGREQEQDDEHGEGNAAGQEYGDDIGANFEEDLERFQQEEFVQVCGFVALLSAFLRELLERVPGSLP